MNRTVLAALISSLVLACNRTPTAQSSAGSKSADEASASRPISPEACGQTAQALCEKLGADHAACVAFNGVKDYLAPEACEVQSKHLTDTLARVEAARGACGELVSKLCGEVEPTTCEMVKETTQKFPTAQCQEMLEHIPEVLNELHQEEAKHKPVSGELLSAMQANDAPGFGPLDAKVTLVEFSDFQCPFCSKAASVVHQIRDNYRQVRFVFRHFPLSFHKQAHLASQVAQAAHAEGKFWEFHDKLFENQNALEPDHLRQYAAQVGMSASAFTRAVEERSFQARVDADLALGEKVFVNGTPTLFVNGKRVEDPSNYELVSRMIDAELAL